MKKREEEREEEMGWSDVSIEARQQMKHATTATTTITFQVCHFAQQHLTTITTRHAATPTHIAWCNASTGRTIRYIIAINVNGKDSKWQQQAGNNKQSIIHTSIINAAAKHLSDHFNTQCHTTQYTTQHQG